MSEKIYTNILKIGIYLSFLSVFLVFRNLLFPFITSKQLYFNILIEILTVFWLVLIVKFPAYRPKKSYITWGLIGFFTAILFSTFFSVDFNLSFWGDVERMLGFFPLLHFFFYYLIIITVFRKVEDWRNLFLVSLIAAIIISFNSLFKNPYAAIGNTAYVSGYVIFNIYFAIILFYKNIKQGINNKELKWVFAALYLIAIFIMMLVLERTRTRGAYVGLAASFFIMFLLYIFFSRNKKIKIFSTAVIMLMVIFTISVFTFRNNPIVRNNSILNTITQISGKATTFQTRLISWNTAFKDFSNHPLLGTGYGNFAITFDKYFDPKFYNYTTSETYFDHAHNNLVDILSTTGVIGLLAYLYIFVAVFYYLFKGLKQKKIEIAEFIIILALILAYFIQNLVVFDSLVTYLSLMILLGYIYWLYNKSELADENYNKELESKEIIALAIAGILMLAVIFQYNFKPWQMLIGTIDGQIAFAHGDIIGGIDAYKKALSYNTVLDRDSRASLINVLVPNAIALTKIDQQKARDILDYTIDLAEKNVKLNPSDSMMQMQLAQILNTASAFHTDSNDQFYFYSDRALKAMDESIKASPGRATIYFAKAQIYIMRNDKDNAVKTLEDAIALNKDYSEGHCQLAKVDIYYKDEANGYKYMDQCLDLGGVNYLNPADFVKVLINHYADLKDKPRQILLFQRLVLLENDAQYWVNLAKLYADTGDKINAKAAAEKAGSLDPNLKQGADDFIKSLDK